MLGCRCDLHYFKSVKLNTCISTLKYATKKNKKSLSWHSGNKYFALNRCMYICTDTLSHMSIFYLTAFKTLDHCETEQVFYIFS